VILVIEKEALDRPLRRTRFGKVNGFVVRHYEMNNKWRNKFNSCH